MTASFEYGSESRKTLLSEREMAADVMASSASSSSVNSAAVRRRAAFLLAMTASTCWKPTARERREDAEKEAAFKRRFRPLDPGGPIDFPCTVVDADGRVEAWYLPNVIQEHRQVGAFVQYAAREASRD